MPFNPRFDYQAAEKEKSEQQAQTQAATNNKPAAAEPPKTETQEVTTPTFVLRTHV